MLIAPTPIGVAWAVAKPIIKRFWKPVAIVLVVGAAWWGFTHWRDNLVEAAEKKGFATAEAQYRTAVDAANKIAANDTQSMQILATAFGGLAGQRAQAIDLKVTPIIDRIRDEVANDPRYRDCAVSDGMLANANAARSAVDAGIAASNPKAD